MADDPYKYFRIEARELLESLGKGLLELEKGPSKEIATRLLRLAHTLKGAARVVRLVEVADLAHSAEDALAGYRDGRAAPTGEETGALLRLVDAMTQRVAALDAPAPSPTGTHDAASPAVEAVRVSVAEVNELIEAVTLTRIQFAALERELASARRAFELARALSELLAAPSGEASRGPGLPKARALAEDLRAELDTHQRANATATAQIEGELTRLREAANRLRLVPASSIFAALELAANDAARSVGKGVAFNASGGDQRLDGHVLQALQQALLHAVRNSVAHGVEARAVRTANGKPPAGRIDLTVERRGDRVVFACRDDGAGMDIEGLRSAAIRRGSISAAEAATIGEADLLRLVMGGGLTTMRAATPVAGRAVGLDVVRETAERLRGEVRLETRRGAGTLLEIEVPISLSSLRALDLEAGGTRASIPLEAVVTTLRVPDADLARTAERETVIADGAVVPFIPLREALQGRGPSVRSTNWSVAVVRSSNGLVAIGADRLLGTSPVVVRTLPPCAQLDPVVAGVSLDDEGRPQPVLDPAALVRAVSTYRPVAANGRKAPRPPILVIDDSLTTRMLEQSILESAGYLVEVATSAEEALEKANAKAYALFVVDVEMPGMDGFEFVVRTRADARLREVPAILVTSRNDAADLRRGRDVGARAYIVKGEFDQNHLLRTIRELVG